MSDRSLFLLTFVLGSLAAPPGWALAAGQWCNNDNVIHRATLTLRAATVGGRPVTLPSSTAYDVTSSPYESNTISAHLFCVGCSAQSVLREGLERAP